MKALTYGALVFALATPAFGQQMDLTVSPRATAQQASKQEVAVLPTAIVPTDAPTVCVPFEGGMRRTWTCNGRHTISLSEPQASCREVGRTITCERE